METDNNNYIFVNNYLKNALKKKKLKNNSSLSGLKNIIQPSIFSKRKEKNNLLYNSNSCKQTSINQS